MSNVEKNITNGLKDSKIKAQATYIINILLENRIRRSPNAR